MTVILIVIDTLEIFAKGLERELEELQIVKTNRDDPNYSVVEISQNSEKSLDETGCLSNSSERQLANSGERKKKNTKEVIW